MNYQNKRQYTLPIMFSMILVVLLTASVAPNSTFTGILRHDIQIEKYREIGKLPQFECVGRYSSSRDSKEFAAGVLISPNWVLTAAHFVEDSSVWLFGNSYYRTQEIVKHPQLSKVADDRKAQWDGFDMALVRLDRPVRDIAPASRYQGDAELGMAIVKIGYGYVGNGLSGMDSRMFQERLGGYNQIDLIGGLANGINLGKSVLVCDFDNPDDEETNKFGSPVPLELEIGGSKGDSGGGVFSENDGEWQLVGIVSGALNRDVKYGSMIAIARVSTANAWIDQTIQFDGN